jgi:hypothetical protein
LSSDSKGKVVADLDCWYDNGFAASQWKLDKNSKWVTGCTLHLTDDRFELHCARNVFHCPWPGIGVSCTASDQGNAIVKVTANGAAGGTAALVLPTYSRNAFWSELWRVVARMRPRLEAVQPEMLPTGVASTEVMLDYLGGYSLRPKKSVAGMWVSLGRFSRYSRWSRSFACHALTPSSSVGCAAPSRAPASPAKMWIALARVENT